MIKSGTTNNKFASSTCITFVYLYYVSELIIKSNKRAINNNNRHTETVREKKRQGERKEHFVDVSCISGFIYFYFSVVSGGLGIKLVAS